MSCFDHDEKSDNKVDAHHAVLQEDIVFAKLDTNGIGSRLWVHRSVHDEPLGSFGPCSLYIPNKANRLRR